MKNLHIYDPALCCSSGVCGPSVDPALVQLSSDLEALKAKGIAVERHNLAQQAADFAANPLVAGILKAHGQDALPLVVLNDRVIASGFYPSRAQFFKVLELSADIEAQPQENEPEEASCGCGPEGCCS
ncbi:MAG: arsenite efflux transporter metallochaperone ArsD [Verrucomicrobia bacterium]|nr:arsenite efflux transporter metallochaperone ArsD [Verrucomicrobiota bacterium]MCH8511501.1 arsenite efflux transporter metallochaperone ArsD [Kiritimatiellia bacterium]